MTSKITMSFITLFYSAKENGTFNNQEMYELLLDYKSKNPSNNTWYSDTYNSLRVIDLNKIEYFKPLVECCKNHVIKFSKEYGVVTENLICNDAWFNIAHNGEYQEFHYHPKSHFSVVYYIKAPTNCGKIILKSHEEDMFPLPTITDTPATLKLLLYEPVESDIIIFRSNLHHMVEKNMSGQDRVSIAMNFSFAE
jgi:uncharacterized protein (TIGR02466 family)